MSFFFFETSSVLSCRLIDAACDDAMSVITLAIMMMTMMIFELMMHR